MISNSKEADLSTKQEGCNTNDGNKDSTSSPWIRTKDPRIVRVSRAFGGKDRHSKVCTIRGLRDRRVRLSVPTAIQLYDLQDRLGFNQPSKVVDWLLDAAKHEIDELPPLPLTPGHFSQNYHSMLASHQAAAASSPNQEGLKGKGDIDLEDSSGLLGSNFWNSGAFRDANKSKEVVREADEKEGMQEGNDRQDASSTYNFLTKTYNHPSFQGLLNNAMPYGSNYQHLEPSNISLSHGFASQTEDLPNLNIVTMPSALSLSTGSQILVCPPGAAQSYFPSYSMEIDPRQINQFQMLNTSSQNLLSNPHTQHIHSTSQTMRPFHFNLASKNATLHSQESGGSHPNKEQ